MPFCGTSSESPIPARATMPLPSRPSRNRSALDPDLAEAHNLLGAALAGCGRPGSQREGVTDARSESIPTFPTRSAIWVICWPRAAIWRKQALSLRDRSNSGPTMPTCAPITAVTLAALNRLDEAQQQIEAALKVDPLSADAHNFRGTLLERKGRSGEALAEFLEAVRLRPSFGRAHLSAARLLAGKGDRASAESHLRQAAKSADPNVQRQAAAELQRLGRQQ